MPADSYLLAVAEQYVARSGALWTQTDTLAWLVDSARSLLRALDGTRAPLCPQPRTDSEAQEEGCGELGVVVSRQTRLFQDLSRARSSCQRLYSRAPSSPLPAPQPPLLDELYPGLLGPEGGGLRVGLGEGGALVGRTDGDRVLRGVMGLRGVEGTTRQTQTEPWRLDFSRPLLQLLFLSLLPWTRS